MNNNEMNEEEIQKFLHALFEEIYNKYGFYISKL